MAKLSKDKKTKRKVGLKEPKKAEVFSPDSGGYSSEAAEALRRDVSKMSFDPILLTEKIIEFGKVLTGIPIYDYQYFPAFRVIYSVITIEGADISLLFARQSGKSEVMAFVIDTLAVILPILAKIFPELDQYKNGIKIGLFAPQSDQTETTYTRAMLRLQSEEAEEIMSDPDIDTGLTSSVNLHLTNGSYLFGQIVSKVSKIESKTYDLVIIEEAQDTDSYIVQKSIEPMTSATNGTIVKVGTTGTKKNHFWEDIQSNKSQSRRQKDPRLKNHFEYNYQDIIKYKRKQFEIDGKIFHLNYEKDVLRKRQKWGEDSDAFRLSYKLVWALDVGMFITDRDWDLMINRKKGFPKKIEKNWRMIAGLDVGKTDASTVLTIGYIDTTDLSEEPKRYVTEWIELHGDSYEEQHNVIMDAIIENQIYVLALDYTGVGKAFGDRLIASCQDYVIIIPYTFSRPSKSDMWTALLNAIRSGNIEVPAHKSVQDTEEFEHFKEQITGLNKFYEGSYLVAQKPDEIGAHDDYADSLGLFNIAATYVLPDQYDIEDEDENPLQERLNDIRRVSTFAAW